MITMRYLLPGVDRNAEGFSKRFPLEIAAACESGLENTQGFRDSYRRVVSLQAWRTLFFEPSYRNSPIVSMFLEAQNDALLSVVLAHTAMWRPALQSLRSCVENVLSTCYYVDHPIEFRLWEKGKHRIGFSALESYFSRHPDIAIHKGLPNILSELEKEYATLSKAVHASARPFLMTREGSITITNNDKSRYNQWNTRHFRALQWLNFLLLVLNASAIKGAQRAELRKSISLAIPYRYHNDIVEHLGVHLFPLE